MIGIGEVGEQGVKVSVEVRESAERRERLADTLQPPFPLEAPKLTIAKTEPEGQAGRRTEGTAKTGGDGILGGIEAEPPRQAGISTPDRLARLEQRAGGVEEYGADQRMRNLKGYRSSFLTASRRLRQGPPPALRRNHRGGPTRRCRTARRMRRDKFWAVRRASRAAKSQQRRSSRRGSSRARC